MLPEINGVYRDLGSLDLGSGDLGTEARKTISTPNTNEGAFRIETLL